MSKYFVEHRIRTVSENAVMAEDRQASFTIEGIEFYHEDFESNRGWLSDFWLARAEIETSNFNDAYGKFLNKLKKIIPKIALVGQCYINFINESFLISKSGSDNAFLGLSVDRKPTGLLFQENEKQALNELLTADLPESFFKYWNDAVNTTGYASKLLIMLSALEALVKKPDGGKDWNKLVTILGEDLKNFLYEPVKGLRHRLIHGEYFNGDDTDNFVEKIHKAVISYFNCKILNHKINEDVISPQRNFFENKEGGFWFIKRINLDSPLNFKSIVEALNTENLSFKENYDFDFNKELYKTF